MKNISGFSNFGALRYYPLAIFSLLIAAMVFSCKKTDRTAPPEQLTSAAKVAPARDLDLHLVQDGFASPIALMESPDRSGRLFVVDQTGQVWIIANGQKLMQPFIDVSSRMVSLNAGYDERGLLGLAFHPDFSSNGKFYLYYTTPPPATGPGQDANNISRISEFAVSGMNHNMANLASERILLEIPQPQSNHEGGTIAFGADGYLYISIGDGGNKNDIGTGHVEDWYAANEGGNGQDIEANLLGNILRIDVNTSGGGKNYGIPSDNPFVGKRGLDEIWAYGFRNPYRFSFDMSGSRRMFVGDAGQVLYEEISVVEKGGNYGWNVKEGTHCFNAADETTELSSCPDVDEFGNRLIDPVIEVKNHANPEGGEFVVVVGGYVYRGNSIPGLNGKYIFGNFSEGFFPAKGQVYLSQPAGPGLWPIEKISFKSFPDHLGQYLKGFGQDLSGEVYVLTSGQLGPTGNSGKVYKMVGDKKK